MSRFPTAVRHGKEHEPQRAEPLEWPPKRRSEPAPRRETSPEPRREAPRRKREKTPA